MLQEHRERPVLKEKAGMRVCRSLLAMWIACQAGEKIARGNPASLEFAAVDFAGCGVVIAILRNWRTGFYFFLGWLLFEDVALKCLGGWARALLRAKTSSRPSLSISLVAASEKATPTCQFA
jgi:hypothetical protein